MNQLTLKARAREERGKSAARKIRQNNQIPAVFYGPRVQPLALSVEVADLQKVLRQTSSENIILELQIQTDGGTDSRTVILKELQVDPVRPVYYHADFYEIPMDKELSFQIPLYLVNTPIGASKGGILEHVLRELTVICLPTKLVERIEVDVSGLDMGGSLHVRDIQLPEGIRTTQDENQTVALVAAPVVKETKAEEAVEEEGEAAEAEGATEEKKA
ncbi:MAG: 50S ribosomal protein L25 [Thermodesulfobacteriota bacterium]